MPSPGHRRAPRVLIARAACAPVADSRERQLLRDFADLRVCMLAIGVPPGPDDGPRSWASQAATLVLETRLAGQLRRAAADGRTVDWTINGHEAPVDTTAAEWRTAVLNLLDASYHAGALRDARQG